MPRTAVRKPLRLVLIGVPVAAAVGALALPALAAQHGTGEQGLARHTAPAAFASARPTAAGATSTPSATSPLDAYFDAGYGYSDAVLLARMWGHGTRPGAAKVRAGAKLQQGVELPVRPGQTAATVSEEAALEAFFNHGFDYDDAARIAKAWHTVAIAGNLGPVKVGVGRNILAGRRVMAKPAGLPDPAKLLRVYRHAGYGNRDAVLLARLWDLTKPYDAMLTADQKLAGHVDLTLQPGDTPATASDDAAFEAYFNHGYDYDDAVRLARIWHLKPRNIADVKSRAGHKLLAGKALPVKP